MKLTLKLCSLSPSFSCPVFGQVEPFVLLQISTYIIVHSTSDFYLINVYHSTFNCRGGSSEIVSTNNDTKICTHYNNSRKHPKEKVPTATWKRVTIHVHYYPKNQAQPTNPPQVNKTILVDKLIDSLVDDYHEYITCTFQKGEFGHHLGFIWVYN